MVVCGVSIIITAILILQVSRRRAAVGALIISWLPRSLPQPPTNRPLLAGRVELRSFLMAYILSLALQIVTTGSVLEQGGTPIVVLTAIHAGVVAASFWLLFFNGLVATQVCLLNYNHLLICDFKTNGHLIAGRRWYLELTDRELLLRPTSVS